MRQILILAITLLIGFSQPCPADPPQWIATLRSKAISDVYSAEARKHSMISDCDQNADGAELIRNMITNGKFYYGTDDAFYEALSFPYGYPIPTENNLIDLSYGYHKETLQEDEPNSITRKLDDANDDLFWGDFWFNLSSWATAKTKFDSAINKAESAEQVMDGLTFSSPLDMEPDFHYESNWFTGAASVIDAAHMDLEYGGGE
ncbi:hypothetical protein [Crateriforma spongiae]|uniref:hypothetical protein n=1 Tax=Crateriforma spongiae TaxID=2724528 RepID=UPI0039AEA048